MLTFSCSDNIGGVITERNIDLSDFGKNDKWEFVSGKLDYSDLNDKYSKDALELFDWYMSLGCSPEISFSEPNQIILKNTSKNKKLRFTINKTIKKYQVSNIKGDCFKPIRENPKVIFDTDYETLNPGEYELLGINKTYLKGKYVEIEYELAGALEVK